MRAEVGVVVFLALVSCRGPDAPAPWGGIACESGVRVDALATSQPHDRDSDHQVDLVLSTSSDAALLCVARDDRDDRFLLESPAATAHTFPLQGLRHGATYDCAAGPVCGSAEHFEIEVGPSPPFDPPIAATWSGDRPRGWVLAGVMTEGCRGAGALAIFDPAGRLRWQHPLAYSGADFELTHLGGGVLLYGGHTDLPGPVALHVWDGTVWEADVPGDPYLHHDTKRIADGRVITLEERQVTAGDQTWTGFAVQAFDPATMGFDYDYDSQAGVDQGVFPPGVDDAWHANWVDLKDHGAGGKLYVSLCNLQTVHAIDVATGSVDWTFGRGGDFELVDPAGQPLPDDHFPQCQHGLEVSEDGSRLLVYDNGRVDKTSRAVEYSLDPAAGRATELWSWTDGWYEDTMGDVDWLPGGTVLVTQGHPECWSTGDRTELVEIEPTTGAEKWRFTFLDEWDAVYRSERLDGCELFSNVGECAALEPRWDEIAPRFGL